MASSGPAYGSIAELQTAIRDGRTTVKGAVEGYLNVIQKQNADLNAVTLTNHKAIEEAERLDNLPVDQRGPLFGVPILIKDQIETEGIATSFGSKTCKDYVPRRDAELIQKLKNAGAIVLGKTTMCDWAAGFFSASSLSGTTKHPIDPSRDPGGSSAGSGTAIAANMALTAIGGDTGGSIRLPSSFCGLVGVRVTPGRISRDGMSALVKTQDTPGPMCRTVEDAARILDVIVGFDEKDDFTSINSFTGRSALPDQFTNAVRQPFLEGKRLGVLREAFGTHKGINAVLDQTISNLKNAGVELIDVSIPGLEDYKASTSPYILRSKKDINSFLESREELKHLRIEEIYQNGDYHPACDLIDMLVKGPTDPFQSPHSAKHLTQKDEFQRVVASIFAKHNLDAMVYPTCTELAPKTQSVLDREFTHLPNTVIGSQLLWTALSVPIGKTRDDRYPDDPELPVGLEILGVPLSEERILNIAAGVEALQQKQRQ
ncbi:amidase family [Lecanosticta acicola]|uniref:Amidase family n=1 Tax=Lecanosticta acicola TaxID=111012 RepID=A0AAI9E929_9PEZI|nr:amidase family [Lecanosticta acicola]